MMFGQLTEVPFNLICNIFILQFSLIVVLISVCRCSCLFRLVLCSLWEAKAVRTNNRRASFKACERIWSNSSNAGLKLLWVPLSVYFVKFLELKMRKSAWFVFRWIWRTSNAKSTLSRAATWKIPRITETSSVDGTGIWLDRKTPRPSLTRRTESLRSLSGFSRNHPSLRHRFVSFRSLVVFPINVTLF